MKNIDNHIALHVRAAYYLTEIKDVKKDLQKYTNAHRSATVKEQVEYTKLINLAINRINELEITYRHTIQQIIEPFINQ